MTFLILKMFVYLILAGVTGFGAGWLMRHIQGQRADERWRLAAQEANAKVPEFESLLQGREDQIRALEVALDANREEMRDKDEVLASKNLALQENERALKRYLENSKLTQGLTFNEESSTHSEVSDQCAALDADEEANMLITELSREIVSLKAELKNAPTASTVLTGLKHRVTELEQALELASEDLDRERTAIAALESERELQNRSLKLLHQQLQHARTGSIANTG
jgi:chromosome segregation ATPase